MPKLEQIFLYPIKSLDGVAVEQGTILAGGSLAYDREFALFDADGQVVNAKRTAEIHKIRASFDLAQRTVTLWTLEQWQPQTFHLDGDRPSLEAWFSAFFGEPITLQQDTHLGFPDDIQVAGPTIVSRASLEAVATWFPELSVAEIRRRFRANLELSEAPAFWEDCLYGEPQTPLLFQIGAVAFQGSHPCQRCIVPTRDAQKGDRTPKFQAHFATQRQATLPAWATPSHFNHYYRLTTNTQIPATEAGKTLQVGDLVSLT